LNQTARATLEEIANSVVTQFQRLLAHQILEVLNDGTFKPT
jgi:hypothetical protein